MPEKYIRGSIKFVKFNQNFECFVCGNENFLQIFNSDPLKEVRREFFPHGISFVELLYRCNYEAVVGSFFPSNEKVLLWDCTISKAVIELDMGEPVFGVRLRRDLIVIIVENALAVFSFSDIPIQLMRVCTASNSRGICALSTSEEHPYMAFPSDVAADGVIEVVHLRQKNRRRIYAHSHALQTLAFNLTGNLIASASIKGTLIRIFNVVTGILIREFRRGTNNAKISCLNFSSDSKFLCVSSNHSTIHVFELEKGVGNFGILKGVPSALKIHVSKKHQICQCAFQRNSTSIIAIGLDGSYYSFYLDKNTGQYRQQNYCLFTELNNNYINDTTTINNNNNIRVRKHGSNYDDESETCT